MLFVQLLVRVCERKRQVNGPTFSALQSYSFCHFSLAPWQTPETDVVCGGKNIE